MKKSRQVLLFQIVFGLATCLCTVALPQSDATLDIRSKLSGEFRSDVNRRPGLQGDEDIRLSLTFHVGREWRQNSHQRMAVSYDLQHYRYSESHGFTRYDHALWGEFAQGFGKYYKLTVSDEFRFRSHPATTQFNYAKNVIDLNLRRRLGDASNLAFGLKNLTKTYPNDPSLSRYISHRAYIKFSRAFNPSLNIGARIEYQNHRGNLYPGSTAPQQDLNVTGERVMLRLNLERIFSSKVVASVGYKYALDLADDFGIDESSESFSDEDEEELLAEDADFGYAKQQGSLSMHLKANRRIAFLFFYLYYNKGFRYWRTTPDGPRRQDNVWFVSHKIRFKLSKRFGVDIRHTFEANFTNLSPYRYKINSLSIGLHVAS